MSMTTLKGTVRRLAAGLTPGAIPGRAAASALTAGAAGGASAPTATVPLDTLVPQPSPRQMGFRMPAEFEPHGGTWMGWPYNPHLWREGAGPAQAQYAEVVRAVAGFEPVTVFADPSAAASACSLLGGAPGVEVVELPTDCGWARDWGPTCVVRDDPQEGGREVAGVLWAFNCYGADWKREAGRVALMPSWERDAAAGAAMLARARLRPFACGLHLEGGSIHADGQGTLLTTAECLLHPSRNPGLGREAIQAVLCEMLGASKVIWLERGMMGDEGTDGHVDNMACWAAPGHVLLAWSDDPNDPQHEVCARNLEILEGSTDAAGRRLQVTKLPVPSPPMFLTFREAAGLAPPHVPLTRGSAPHAPGARLPASYINFYIANGGVVVPQFGGAQAASDAAALEVLAAAFPGRRAVGVQSREVLLGGGNIHCITQQVPAGRPAPPPP